MPSLSRIFLLLFACLLTCADGPVGPARAQDRPAQREERRADLYLWVSGQGLAYVGLRSDTPLPDTKTLQRVLERAMDGSISLIALERFRLPNGNWVLTADFSPALQNQGGLHTGRFDPSPLLPLLQRRGLDWLTVNVTAQDLTSFSVSGAERLPSKDRHFAYGYQYFETDASSPRPVVFTYGYARKDILYRVLPLIAVLLLPIALTFWVRRRALRTEAAVDPAVVWFGYGRFLQWLSLAPWVIWVAALIASDAVDLFRFVFAGTWFARSGLTVIVWCLPSMVIVWCYALSHPVFAHVRGLDYSRRDLIRQAAWGQARFLPLFFLITAINELHEDPHLSILWLTAALAALIVVNQGAARAMGTFPHALTVGDLRDRVFHLATQAGVRVQQVYVVPGGKGRLVNAFASTGNVVMLTDLLLERLSQREVDAVVAHELTHLRRRHPAALVFLLLPQMFLGVILATVIGGRTSTVIGGVMYAIGVLIGLLLMYFFSRRFEYAADAGALRLTNDPQACITGLTKISRLNQMPLEWGRHQSHWLTHPATLRRIEAIARQSGIPAQEIPSLVSSDTTEMDVDHYTLPSGISDGVAFTTAAKSAYRLRLSWLLIGVTTLTPALVAVLSRATHLTGGAAWTAAAAGFFITGLLYHGLSDWEQQRWDKTMERRFRTNLMASDPSLSRGGEFVTLAPAAMPRIYEGFFDWDIGLLSMENGRLRFVGEQSRFTLTAGQIAAVEARADTPGLAPWSRIYVTWQGTDQDATTQIFNLRPIGIGGQRHSRGAAQSLTERLKNWRESASDTTDDPTILPPTESAVTSSAPRSMASPRAFLSSLLFQGGIALCVCAFWNLPFAWADGGGAWSVLSVTGLVTFFTFLPYWSRHRLPSKFIRSSSTSNHSS